MRLPVYTPTSSGVEQAFSRYKAVFGEARGCISEVSENVLLKLAIDRRPQEEEVVVGMAREVWSEFFGACRMSPSAPRADTGTRKRKAAVEDDTTDLTETAWLDKRAASIASLPAPSMADQDGAIAAACVSMWGDAHKKEVEFQEQKGRAFKVEAFLGNMLLESEIDKDIRLDAAKEEAKRESNTKARNDKVAKAVQAMNPKVPSAAELEGKTAFIEAEAKSTNLTQVLNENNIGVTTERAGADFYVATSIASPGVRTAWWAVAKGAFVFHPDHFVRGHGAVLKYKRAADTKRTLWLSSDVRQKHPKIVEIIEHFALREVSKWKLLKCSLAEFISKYDKAKVAHKGCNFIAIVRGKEEAPQTT
jgi:hypothetical protein